jgi:hypothetical protein
MPKPYVSKHDDINEAIHQVFCSADPGQIATGVESFRRMAETAGCFESMYYLGRHHLLTSSPKDSWYWLEKATSEGVVPAGFFIFKLYEKFPAEFSLDERDYAKACLEWAAGFDHVFAIRKLVVLHLRGAHGYRRSLSKALTNALKGVRAIIRAARDDIDPLAH